MNRRLTLGSLFDGIGGFILAARKAGIQPVWSSEIEPFPIRVTEKRFPDVLQLGDVRGINGADIPAVDIITFGFPCQDVAVCGLRSGLEGGKRTSLFFEAVRIIKEMRQATSDQYPRFCVFENVPGLFTSASGRDYQTVLRELIQIAEAGADVPLPAEGKWLPAGEIVGDHFSLAWRVLDAVYFGVAQRRKRIYAVLDLGGQCAGKALFESESLSGFAVEGGEAGQRYPCAAEGGITAAGFCTEHSADSRGIGYAEEESPTLRAGVVPGVAIEFHPSDDRIREKPDGICQTLCSRMGTGGNQVPLVGMPIVYGICSDQSHAMLSDNPHSGIYEAETTRTLDCNGGGCQCNQGGMAVVEKRVVAMNVGLFNSGEDSSPPILARDYKDPPVINQPEYLVRRLSTLECTRLQGYPDDWLKNLECPVPTDDEIDRWTDIFARWNAMQGVKPRSRNQIIKWLQNPNTERAEYKALGNSIAIPCGFFVLAGIVWAAGKENKVKRFWNWTKNEDTGQRELWLEGVIAEESWWGDEITPAIFKEELHAGSGPVLLHISSPGGDCVAASQIYTFLMDYPFDVIVQIDGLAASAASVIAMAGTTVRMSPTALMMLHNPWTTAMGDAADMQKAIDLLDEVKESIINAYQIKTGLSRAKISHIMDSETWLNAHKAKELGFCDEVLYEEDGAAEGTGGKPDFIFSAKTAAVALMNKVLGSIPKPPAVLEHPPDPEPEGIPASPPANDQSDTEPPESPEEPVTPIPDNRVKAADLEKRLSLLK